jgi:DNA topoisomerase I
MFEAPSPALKEPNLAAEAAGLTYVSDESAGITRLGKPGRFRYRDARGKPVKDAKTLARIRKLAIPPAWTRVWFAPAPDAHLQATGRDAKGRKQYRYHPDFIAVRDGTKYAHLVEFAAVLPQLRKRLRADLRGQGLTREKVMATVVTLLEETLIRIGNEDYARANASFGLTTLRNRHVQVKGQALRFQFKGKSGKLWDLSIHDSRVAKVVASCQELPGQHLFEYRDGEGAARPVSSTDVNNYLREITGRAITAKDFRTWAGTVKAGMGFARIDPPPTKKAVRAVIAAVAQELGNTVAVCRRCYIHPAVIAAFEEGGMTLRMPRKGRKGLSRQELAVLGLLRKRLSQAPAGGAIG